MVGFTKPHLMVFRLDVVVSAYFDYPPTSVHRHPKTSGRPNFPAVVQLLSRSDLELLKWSEEDKTAHPEATLLGTKLDMAARLFRDLQTSYSPKSDNTSDYAQPEPIDSQ